MLSFLRNIQNHFEASALKVANQEAPVTNFEKFHVLTLDYRTPIIAAVIYVVIVSFFSRLNRTKAAAESSGKRVSARGKASSAAGKEESRFTPFKCLVIAHNLFLCLYSATAFLSVLPILLRPYFTNPFLEAFCDADKKVFSSGLHYWVWNFYVSKYYELIDTAILLLKGKPSSFLQTFHHSGSIIGMWVMTTTHAPAAWIFVLFNSFIHTVMYFYYTLTCFGYRPSWKKILTTMQIVQFLVGNPLGLAYAFIPSCLPPEAIPPENIIGHILGSQIRSLYACLFVNTFFISSLVVLFTDFSRKTYGKKFSAAGKPDTPAVEKKTSVSATSAASAASVAAEKKSSKSSSASKRAASKSRAVSKSRARSPSRKPTARAAAQSEAAPKVKSIKAVKESSSSKKAASTKKSESTVSKRKVSSKK